MTNPLRYSRQYIVGRLRQSHGANYMLCQYAADEIQLVRKEKKAQAIEIVALKATIAELNKEKK